MCSCRTSFSNVETSTAFLAAASLHAGAGWVAAVPVVVDGVVVLLVSDVEELSLFEELRWKHHDHYGPAT
ncbi:MAG: hypothetical protein E6G49_11950 [Actinobacteria bacterium]|jgi:hypothetical protein|nr:MAG: hypothetical protein E6G49_11950 [Actinomycetota bacterium]